MAVRGTRAERGEPARVDAPPAFDPLDPCFRADPYAAYRRFRRHDPVHFGEPPTPALNSCLYLFRYLDVWRVLSDRRFRRARRRRRYRGSTLRPGLGPSRVIALATQRALLFNDPPDHRRMRALVHQAFMPLVRGLEPRIAEIADALLDDVAEAGAFDVMTDFAIPLPVLFMADLLGLDRDDWRAYKRWSGRLVRLLDARAEDDVMEEAAAAVLQLAGRLREVVDARRRRPRDDLITRLLSAEVDGMGLSEPEIIANGIFLLAAGYETTVSLIGNGVLALMRNPPELERVRARPEHLDSAVDELLRYDSPVQLVFRVCGEPAEVGGVTVPEGCPVLAAVGAANRDPEVFPDPDRLDVTRAPNRHLAFGVGSHACLGSRLARAECRVALRTLLDRVPDMTLAPRGPERMDTVFFRALRSLPVRRA